MNASRAGLLAAAAILGAVPGAGPGPPLSVEVRGPETGVVLGVAFPVTVVRTWRVDLLPERWDDDALAPLRSRTVQVQRRAAGGRIEEIRRLRAYAFRGGGLTVPPLSFSASDAAGTTRRVEAEEPLELTVRTTLDPGAPGDPELPEGPLPYGSSRVLWILVLVVAIAAVPGAWWWARRRRRRAAPPAEDDPADVRALVRLTALRDRPPRDRDEHRVEAATLSALVCGYLAERFGLRVSGRTTADLLGDPATERALPRDQGEPLAGLLGHCDKIKFARHAPAPEDRERWLTAAEDLVLATRPGPVANGGPGP